MKRLMFLLILSALTIPSYAQQFSLTGKVTDRKSGEPLSFANVRVSGTTSGTAANSEGNFELRLKAGKYTIITSFIGYLSDTLNINIDRNYSVKIELEPSEVRLSEITVLAGENPANAIIRKAIAAKEERYKKIENYVFKAYTKGLVKTTKDFTTSNRSVGLSISTKDTGSLKITGIIENESRGFFKKPNSYKDEIIARKQSSNTPSTINILTGGRLIQDFYSNDIRFFGRQMLGPIADDALDFYYYIIEDTLSIDNRNVYQISFEPIDKSDPGFYGRVFILDEIFAMIKLDLYLNDAANPGGIFSKVNIFQQFVPFENNIYMPIDYRIFVEGNFLGLAKFGFELNSVFYDYNINQPIDENVFDEVIIKVLPDADKKDSTYWKTTQTIPNTLEEMTAYKRIDSLEAIPRNFWDDFSLLSTSLALSDNISIGGPLYLYSFNKISGHSINQTFELRNGLDRRFYTDNEFSYGFSDKKFQFDLSARYLLGNYRTTSVSVSLFNKLTDLFSEAVRYSKSTSTFTSLLGKYDFRDYYYTKGFEARIFGDLLPILRAGIGFLKRTDNNAFNNSDFSIFNTKKSYAPNKLIHEVKVEALTAGFIIDFRKFIEDGYFRQRTSLGDAYATLNGEATLSDKSVLKSGVDFKNYRLTLSGFIPAFKSTIINFSLKGIYSTGTVPFQMMYALPGNIEGVSKSFTFRTLSLGEVYGDKGAIFNLQLNLNDELFRLLNLPLITDMRLTMTSHVNFAWLEISEKSKSVLIHNYSEFKRPFCEAGFGIGHQLFPFTLEFTWRLNYRDKNSFVIGINSFVF